jgi:hypothetical protein
MNYLRMKSVAVCVLALGLFPCSPLFGQDQLPTADHSLTESSIGGESDQSSGSSDNGWHVAVSHYLWFPGMSGTIGVLGRKCECLCQPRRHPFALRYRTDGSHGGPKKLLRASGRFYVGQARRRSLHSIQSRRELHKCQREANYPDPRSRLPDCGPGQAEGRCESWLLGQNLSFQPSGIFSNSSQSANWVFRQVKVGQRSEIIYEPVLFGATPERRDPSRSASRSV